MKYILIKLFLIRVIDEDDPELKEPDQKEDNKPINPAEMRSIKNTSIVGDQLEKKQILEKVILKVDGWYYCKRCEEVTERGPFRLMEKHPNLKLSELKEALIKHGELARK